MNENTKMSRKDEEVLEGILDRVGNAQIVGALSRIAFEKSAHVRTNWQDEKLAHIWTRIGIRFDKLVPSLASQDEYLGF